MSCNTRKIEWVEMHPKTKTGGESGNNLPGPLAASLREPSERLVKTILIEIVMKVVAIKKDGVETTDYLVKYGQGQ